MTQSILSCIQPVLDGLIPSFFGGQLKQYFARRKNHLSQIEYCFSELTWKRHQVAILRSFFQSWGQTNNSAMTISGLSNRLSKLKFDNVQIHDENALLNTIASLNRIADQDLAVVGSILHSELFYTMATNITGDDEWLSRYYLSAQAIEFKRWKDQQSLRVGDLMVGLLTTLIHEIYTFGELEFILPLFTGLLEQHFDLEPMQINRTLAWIKVHCAGTELPNYLHAISAIEFYCAAMNIDITRYDMESLVSGYIQRKTAVMNDIVSHIHQSHLAPTLQAVVN